MSTALIDIARKADEQITIIHIAFGAPGDHGYESREGKALYELYKFQVELRAAISQASNYGGTASRDDLANALRAVLHWYGGDPDNLAEWSDCMLLAREALARAAR